MQEVVYSWPADGFLFACRGAVPPPFTLLLLITHVLRVRH